MLPFDSTDPGLVNVADQAYPIVPPTQQSLPVPRNVFGSDFAPPLPPFFSAGGPVPTDAFVANAANLPPPFSQGSASPALQNIDVKTEVPVLFPVADWLVTETGNFVTNNANGNQFSFKIASVVVTDSGLPTAAYQVFLQAPANLFAFGLDLTGLLVAFPTAAPVSAPENVPQRPIESFNKNWFLVLANDQFGNLLTIPGFGQTVSIGVVREGPDVTSQAVLPVLNILVGAPQQPPPPVLGVVGNFTGNFTASSGVLTPFIGSGQSLPPLLGTFEVENQSLVGQGLPANVFV